MTGPANYRINVVGRLEQSWSGRVGGMRVTELCKSGGDLETVLEGHLADQSALCGVLNTLYELHLPILLVECLESSDSHDLANSSHE